MIREIMLREYGNCYMVLLKMIADTVIHGILLLVLKWIICVREFTVNKFQGISVSCAGLLLETQP